MVELPMVRCPGCGKHLGPVKSRIIPLSEKFEDCLRRCEACRIGLSNAKNPAKVRIIRAGGQPLPEKAEKQQAATAQPEAAPEKPQEPVQEAPEPEAQKPEPAPEKPQEPPQP